MSTKIDIIIVGTGAAGLFCALNLPKDKNILMITKDDVEKSDSFLAQGGICMLKNEEDFESYFEDTMKAGHYENNKESVEIMIRSSQDIIQELIHYGVDFEQENGKLSFTREGGHSTKRILFHKDITGREITSKLLAEVKKLKNVTIWEHTTMLDVLCGEKECHGIVYQDRDGKIATLMADYTVLACGGVGGLYTHSTNFPHLTGDALAISLKHKIELQHIDYIQIHPTTLYSKKKGRRFLISESVRGEGAVLLNKKKERFVNELLPRDILTQRIFEEMKKDDLPYVWLDMEPLGSEEIYSHFPNIYQYCLEEGFDVTKDCIPVVPAQHYFMGGVKVDSNSETSKNKLYAIGETSCNGVHGANRLASNSLLESLVFAKRAAGKMAEEYQSGEYQNKESLFENIDLGLYQDTEKLKEEYRSIILDEMERMQKIHE